MGVFGILKGLKKVVTGIVEGDGAKVLKGVVQTGVSVTTTIVSTVKGDSDKIAENETDNVLDDKDDF